MNHLSVPKTYKLFIGGAFPRSESGRVYRVHSARGIFLANAALASRQDARDAVVSARAGVGGWGFGGREWGRVYRVHSARGIFLANAALASRKDARDAVVSARAAFAGWAG